MTRFKIKFGKIRNIKMSRLGKLTEQDMSPEQRQVASDIASGLRGSFAGGPFEIWLRSPAMADRAQKLGEFVRYRTALPARLSELAILVTARIWTAQFEWQTHEAFALKGGLSQAVIDDLRLGIKPSFPSADEELIYAFCHELYTTKTISAPTYAAAIDMFGEQALVELVGLLGYYAMISMTLNVFDVDTVEARRLLPPL
jgi:4-carboxymuconolactone decarboxylase